MDATTGVRSLFRKLSEVMAAVTHVSKTGHNKFHNYDYATEADIVASVRKAMAERHLVLVHDTEKVEVKDLARKNGTERLATLTVRFTVHDGDSGESMSFHVLGEGTDSGDKATYKALTGAVKYALLKLFLIPTGDDPEKDDDAPPQRQGKREAPRQATPRESSPPLTPAQQETVRKVETATGGKVEAPARVMFGANKGRVVAKLTEAEVSGSLSEADAALQDESKRAHWPAVQRQRALLLARLDEVTQPEEVGANG